MSCLTSTTPDHMWQVGPELAVQKSKIEISRSFLLRRDFRSSARYFRRMLIFSCLPVCGVRHSPVLCGRFLWHIDWAPFKSPVLPPLFTPIVNLYNAVKDCFTHLDYTIFLPQQPDRHASGNERREWGRGEECGGVEWSGVVGLPPLLSLEADAV